MNKPDIKSLLFGSIRERKTTQIDRNDINSFFSVREIKDGIVITNDGRYVKMIEVLPVNFYLKSVIEQQNIIYYFSRYLKIAPSNLQIIVKTQKADIDSYCERMEKFYNTEKNENCRRMIFENAQLVNTLAETEAITRRFFLVFEYEQLNDKSTFDEIYGRLQNDSDTAMKYLDYCGLDCTDFDTDHLNSLLFSVFWPQPEILDSTQKGSIQVGREYKSYLYISGYGYPTQASNAWLAPLVEAGDGINLSFTLKRQRKDKILPKISKSVMINRTRLNEVEDTRMDYEELDSAIVAGLYMKDEMNRNGEDFYYMHTVIEVTADNETLLKERVKAMETLCISIGLTARKAVYMQEQALLSCLPLINLDSDLERRSRRNILTTSAAAAFPFCSFELCDKQGILLGLNAQNNSAVILDQFDSEKYSNASLSLMGMSGAGKTFLIHLLAMRLRMQDVKVFILAPLKGHEYRDACEAIGGKYIKLSPGSTECINIMEIRHGSLDTDIEINGNRGDSVLADKIKKLHIFFSLICPDITQTEHHLLDIAIINVYEKYGITHKNESLYDEYGNFKKMPVLADLHEELSEHSETKSMALATKRFVSGSAASLGGATNVDLNNKYIVLDISELGKDLLTVGMFIALDFLWDEAKRSRIEKKAIFLDEIWELIGAGSNSMAAEFVVEVTKIIRGYGGAAILATQDLVDYFSLEDGKYGKAILNNCRCKILLQLEVDEALTAQKYLGLSDEETLQIIRFGRGQGLLCAGRNRIAVDFRASDTEYNLITTRRDDLEKRKKEKDNES